MHLVGYVWKPTTELTNDPLLDVVAGVVLHVDAGNATSLYNWFNHDGGIESTAFLPKGPEHDKEQFRDTQRNADAQNAGNLWTEKRKLHGFDSLETQGYANEKWTPYQLDGIKDFIHQTHKEHKYPLQVASGYHGEGVGYHSMFSEWNTSHHTCPGPKRIIQFNSIIVPWLKAEAALEKTKYYTAVKGDTAAIIARKFKLSVLELWRLNPGSSLPLKPGTRVRVR
jgi:LysM repeat protein